MIKRTREEENAHMEGVTAYHKEQLITDNPYCPERRDSAILALEWVNGYNAAIHYEQIFDDNAGMCQT